MPHIKELYERMPEISARKLNLAFVALLLLCYNDSLWQRMFEILSPSNSFMLVPYFIVFAAIYNIFVRLLSFSPIYKLTLSAIVLVASFVSYFTAEYGTLFDKTMVQNIFETDTSEAVELLSISLLVHVFITGLIPIIIILKIKIKTASFCRQLQDVVVDVGVSFLVLITVLLVFYKSFSMVFRDNGDIRYRLTPSNYMYYSMRYLSGAYEQTGQPLQAIMDDASLGLLANTKTVTILVIGETARAENFSLNGYFRDTNSRLATHDIINFGDVSACGTTTAVSLPCMFSDLPRSSYKAGHRENVLDVLQRLGISTTWRENNSGCKGVCDRLASTNDINFKEVAACTKDSCFDEVMLEGLDALIDGAGEHKVIVLHQQGSHGPAYYKRYPKQFELFTPACKKKNVSDCDQQHIINAYDNTIAYTDYFLSSIIDRLKQRADIASSMIYVSDHGESLGENGAYLHGLPYFMAPSQQTQVPLVVWLSKGYQQTFKLDKQCLLEKRNEKYSHDNLFHSLLGLYGVSSQTYQAELDLFFPCRTS